MKADAEQSDAKLAVDLTELAQVLVHLFAGLVQVLERSARKLELAARLERDVGPVRAGERDHVPALADRLPAEALQADQHVPDPGAAVIGQRRVVGEPERELLRSEEHTSELQSIMRLSY